MAAVVVDEEDMVEEVCLVYSESYFKTIFLFKVAIAAVGEEEVVMAVVVMEEAEEAMVVEVMGAIEVVVDMGAGN